MTPPASGMLPHRGAGVVRAATLTATEGRLADLVAAAEANATEARSQPGCLSAEVLRIPDQPLQLLVLSRWRAADDLTAFLGWHEGIAHELIAAASAVKPTAVHYPAA